ncbi:hypothetical protein [Vibrio sp. PNB22_4_1]|uniref:hypothetical protein n=1 Tax=unclassified Vibrio TaxID=2614977 RepID=UPI00406A388A
MSKATHLSMMTLDRVLSGYFDTYKDALINEPDLEGKKILIRDFTKLLNAHVDSSEYDYERVLPSEEIDSESEEERCRRVYGKRWGSFG